METAKKKRIGRPLKYKALIDSLEDDTLYSPALIAHHARDSGFIANLSNEEFRKEILRIRHTMARLATNHGFPRYGDGMVILPKQAPSIGWYGSRWKEAAIGKMSRDEK